MRHDREQALERAMHLFWRQGFAATSMKDLEAALRMHPGSIYAAFGSKAGLFRDALDLYSARLVEELGEALDSAPSVPEGIKTYLETAILSRTDDENARRACLLQKAVLELGGSDEELRSHAEKGLAAVKQTLAAAIAKDQEQGVVAASADPVALAVFAQVQIMGIVTLAQTGG